MGAELNVLFLGSWRLLLTGVTGGQFIVNASISVEIISTPIFNFSVRVFL